MLRSRLFALLLVPLLTLAANAGLISTGNIEVPASVFAPGGAALAGGGFTLTHAVGSPQGAVGYAAAGDFEINGGFFGGATGPAPGLATAELDPSRYRYDPPTVSFLGYNPGLPLSIIFSEAMAPATLSNGIVLEAIASPVGTILASPAAVPLTVTYDGPTKKATLLPNAGTLGHNTAYRLTLTTRTASALGMPLAAPVVYNFATLADDAVANSLTAADAETRVEIPSGAAPEDFFVVLRVDPMQEPELLDPAALLAATAKAESDYSEFSAPVTDSIREFTAYTGARALITEFAQPVTIEIPYKDVDLDGVVDGTNPPIRVDSLAVWYLNETKRLWVRLPNPAVDRARKVVSARTDHFSTFALIGAQDTNVSQVRVYPIPFRPNAGNPARYGLASEGIHFDNLPDVAVITIYSLSGRLVKTIRHAGLGEERWLGVNDDGSRVASGVYHYLIKSGSNKKTGKLMVIW